jgi:hypothetical protein
VPPPRDYVNSTGLDSTSQFLRLLKLNGTGSFSAVQGGEQYSVFLNLAGSYTMGSEDNVNRTYLYLWGSSRDATYRELSDVVAGYRFTVHDDAENTQEKYLVDRPNKPYALTVIYSRVAVEA